MARRSRGGRRTREAGLRQLRGAAALRTVTRGGVGAFQISMPVLPDSTRRAITRVVRLRPQIEGAVEAVLADESSKATERIRVAWPVDTGLSKALWEFLRIGPLSYVIQNRAFYAGWVHRKGQPTPLRLTLVREEIDFARLAIAERLRGIFRRVREAARPAAPTPAPARGFLSRIRSLFGVRS